MTDLLLFLLRLTLAAIFATAGFAKLADLRGAEKAALGFGVGGSLARYGPVLLSIGELAISVLLVFQSTSWIAAILAALLLIAFIAMMIYQLARGNAPDCHCFGQIHSEPVGIKSVIRNVLFLLLPSILIYRGPAEQGIGLNELSVAALPSVLALIAVLLMAGAVLYLRSISERQSKLAERIDVLELMAGDNSSVRRDEAGDPHLGRPIGALFPAFNLPDTSGRPITMDDLIRDSRPLLFFFAAPGCEPCAALVPEIAEWRKRLEYKLEIVVMSSGDPDENVRKFGTASATILIDADRATAIAAGARWTPTAVYVDVEGKIASQIAAGDAAIRNLVEQIESTELSRPLTFFTNREHHGRGLKIGQNIPEFLLKEVNGGDITDKNLAGRRHLVAFWSLQCPHCEELLAEIKQWEAARKNGDPGLIVVSDGDPDEHKSLGFCSPVIIDPGYKIAEKFGMFGTPSAVLVNEHGTIISETAVGADNIWALLGRN